MLVQVIFKLPLFSMNLFLLLLHFLKFPHFGFFVFPHLCHSVFYHSRILAQPFFESRVSVFKLFRPPTIWLTFFQRPHFKSRFFSPTVLCDCFCSSRILDTFFWALLLPLLEICAIWHLGIPVLMTLPHLKFLIFLRSRFFDDYFFVLPHFRDFSLKQHSHSHLEIPFY